MFRFFLIRYKSTFFSNKRSSQFFSIGFIINFFPLYFIRYLDRYEKVHYLGESGDRHDEEEDIESRHRRWSARSMHSVPLTYNYHQHNVVGKSN